MATRAFRKLLCHSAVGFGWPDTRTKHEQKHQMVDFYNIAEGQRLPFPMYVCTIRRMYVCAYNSLSRTTLGSRTTSKLPKHMGHHPPTSILHTGQSMGLDFAAMMPACQSRCEELGLALVRRIAH